MNRCMLKLHAVAKQQQQQKSTLKSRQIESCNLAECSSHLHDEKRADFLLNIVRFERKMQMDGEKDMMV